MNMASHSKPTTIDPVCGMQVDPDNAAAETVFNGSKVYFCAEGCKAAFEAEPERFIKPKHKGIWKRYLERLNKSTGGRPPSCCH